MLKLKGIYLIRLFNLRKIKIIICSKVLIHSKITLSKLRIAGITFIQVDHKMFKNPIMLLMF
jgi:hypothetical protein